MKSVKNKMQTHMYFDKVIAENFERLYPHCRQRFCENAQKLANNDPQFFERVFFCDMDIFKNA